MDPTQNVTFSQPIALSLDRFQGSDGASGVSSLTGASKSSVMDGSSTASSSPLNDFISMDSFTQSVVSHLGSDASSVGDLKFDGRAYLSERGSEGLYIAKGPDQKHHAFLKRNSNVIYRECKPTDTVKNLVKDMGREAIRYQPGQASVKMTNSARGRVDKALAKAESVRSGGAAKGGQVARETLDTISSAGKKKSKGFFASLWSKISTIGSGGSTSTGLDAADVKQKQMLTTTLSTVVDEVGVDAADLGGSESKQEIETTGKSTVKLAGTKKKLKMSNLRESIEGQKQSLSDLSVKHKNLKAKDPARNQISTDCKKQVESNKATIEQLETQLKKRNSRKKRTEIKQIIRDLKSINSVLEGIGTGQRESTLSEDKQKVLEIIRPFAEAKASEEQKLSGKALVELDHIAKKYTESDIQQLFDEIAMEGLASPNPPSITISYLTGALGKIGKGRTDDGKSKSNEAWANGSPLGPALSIMNGKYEKSERALTENVEKTEIQLSKAIDDMFEAFDALSDELGIDNPKDKLKDTIADAEAKLEKASTQAEKKQIISDLNDEVTKIIGDFHRSVTAKVHEIDPTFKQLHKDVKDKKDGAVVALAKYRMNKDTPMSATMDKLRKRLPAYSGEAFENQMQSHGLEKVMSTLDSDTVKGSIADAFKVHLGAKQKLEEYNAGK